MQHSFVGGQVERERWIYETQVEMSVMSYRIIVLVIQGTIVEEKHQKTCSIGFISLLLGHRATLWIFQLRPSFCGQFLSLFAKKAGSEGHPSPGLPFPPAHLRGYSFSPLQRPEQKLIAYIAILIT